MSEAEVAAQQGTAPGEDFLFLAAFQQLVLERSHDLITVTDPVGTIVYASPSWQTLLGWDPDSVVGTPGTDYVHPSDLRAAAEAMSRALAGETIDTITARARAAGERWVWIDSTATALYADGKVAYVLVTGRDVTEREELRERVREIDAYYRVADAIARAGTLEELLDDAVETLLDATGADRASVLLYDDDQVMRFHAWRGLSDEYRAATEGHSPWTPDAVDPQPVLVPDVAQAGFEPELARVIEAEGIAALAFVPLVQGGRLVGKFMLYHDDVHDWGEREIQLAETIATHLASASVRMRVRTALRESRELLETIMRTVDEGVVVQSAEGRIVYANDGAARAVGFGSAEEFLLADRAQVLGRFEILSEDGTPLSADELPGRRALRGESSELVVRYRVQATGEERWSIVRANPVRNADGEIELSISVIHDVTAQKLADEQARESAALVDGLYRNAPVGLAFWDHDLRYVRVNEALAEMNEVAAADLVGHRIFGLFPELEPVLGPVFARVQETGEPVLDVEVEGAKRTWLASFYPVRDGVGGVIDDVTAERRAEQQSRFLAEASEMLNETLVADETLGALAGVAVPSFAGHVTVDLYEDGRLRCVGARHVDPEKTEMMLRLREQYPPTVPEHPVQRALRSGEPQFVPDVQAEAESMAHDEQHARAIRELQNTSGIVVPLIARGRTFGAITFGTVPPQPPFTESDLDLAVELGRRASVALDNALLYGEVEARAHAAQALEFVDDGVFLVDGEGIVRLWNPAAAETFRVKPAKAMGRLAEDLVTDWSTLSHRIRPGAGAETVPVVVHGVERWLSISAVRFPGGTVYAFRDMTEERAVDQMKSDFVSTVSHELRTPLAAIYGAALTLQRDDVRLDESQRTGLLDVISSEADRLARIVNDILWASRLDSGQMGIEIEHCDAARLTQQVVEALRLRAPADVEIAIEAPTDLPAVAADPDKLRQVLMNLVDNAVKYSPDGGTVRVALSQSGSRLRFRVEDDGLGIPLGEQSRIFEKFFRLDPQLTRGVGGTGLGLYICRELVLRMNGRIWVVSDGRRGSTFTVELPVAG